MLRAFLSVSVLILLSGCATQFGTRTVPPVHHKAIVKAPVAVAPPVVAAPVAAPVPAPKPTFRQRLLRKFIRQKTP